MIDDLKKSADFQREMKELWDRHQKQPKMFHPTSSVAVEEWKYDSGWIAGFEFLYQQLTGGPRK